MSSWFEVGGFWGEWSVCCVMILGCHDYHAFPFQEENIDERENEK